MTVQQAHDYFDLLCDKMESGYFTDDEKDNLLSQACIEYVKTHIPSAENPGGNFEIDEVSYGNIYTLIYITAGLNMNASGVITVANVQSALNTASGSTEAFMAIPSVNWTKSSVTYPVKWTRLNNYWKDIRNPFKAGDATEPIYKFDKTNFIFYPVDTNASVTFTLLKQPKATDLSDGTTIELPSHTHKKIVEMAVGLAGINLREGDLTALKG
jgi:hypothetical protein